jgi:D-serine deaminase-like pyridoxal phosphate-dependent protein
MKWYKIDNEEEVFTPSMLLYPERIAHNIEEMVSIAGDSDRLWPHVKTHKIPEIIKLQLKAGITKFKCSTIAEGEMVAECKPSHILIAYPLAKSGLRRFLTLVKKYPEIRWGVVTDSSESINEVDKLNEEQLSFDLYLDLDVGMHRTGIAPGKEALGLYALIANNPRLSVGGLHVYDGQNHQPDLAERKEAIVDAYQLLEDFLAMLKENDLPVPNIIAGGSPTFALHAEKYPSLSPGTTLLWDAGYGSAFPDLNFQHAAVLITRIVSKPGKGLLTVDLGHKAVASEMTHDPIFFMQLEDFKVVTHSEEHMVLQTQEADQWEIGDCLYGIPWHICPSMALHETVGVVRNGHIADEWNVVARKRKITI